MRIEKPSCLTSMLYVARRLLCMRIASLPAVCTWLAVVATCWGLSHTNLHLGPFVLHSLTGVFFAGEAKSLKKPPAGVDDITAVIIILLEGNPKDKSWPAACKVRVCICMTSPVCGCSLAMVKLCTATYQQCQCHVVACVCCS